MLPLASIPHPFLPAPPPCRNSGQDSIYYRSSQS